MSRRAFWSPAALALSAVLLAGTLPSASATESPAESVYSSKTPYVPQGTPSDYSAAPEGFSPVYTESVGRHGSRALSSAKYDDLMLQVWEAAREKGQLTELGVSLGPEIRSLTAANEKIGYGNLTDQGRKQLQGIGQRVGERMSGLSDDPAHAGRTVDLLTSGEPRATESGQNFARGLASAVPGLADRIPTDLETSRETLYFHALDANKDYRKYSKSEAVARAVDAVKHLPRSEQAAEHALATVFAPEFVQDLKSGKYRFVDKAKGTTVVENPVDAAMMLYNLDIISVNMTQEGSWDFARYLPREDALWFSYLLDAEDFYEKGPAFRGSRITYAMAQPLLDDFFLRIDRAADGRSRSLATFRFTHAEEIIPFSALLGLPGSDEQVGPGQMYDYATNSWRGAAVAPMAANIQWDVYGDPRGRRVVRMLVNEKETAFRNTCRPVAAGSYFYAENELKRCLGTSVPMTDEAPVPAPTAPSSPVPVPVPAPSTTPAPSPTPAPGRTEETAPSPAASSSSTSAAPGPVAPSSSAALPAASGGSGADGAPAPVAPAADAPGLAAGNAPASVAPAGGTSEGAPAAPEATLRTDRPGAASELARTGTSATWALLSGAAALGLGTLLLIARGRRIRGDRSGHGADGWASAIVARKEPLD